MERGLRAALQAAERAFDAGNYDRALPAAALAGAYAAALAVAPAMRVVEERPDLVDRNKALWTWDRDSSLYRSSATPDAWTRRDVEQVYGPVTEVS